MPPRMLELGTLFKGTLDPSFQASITKIKELLNEMSSTLAAASGRIETYKRSMASTGSELSQYQMMMGRATVESQKFQDALAKIASGTQRTGIALQQSWNSVAKAERGLAQLGIQMTAQGANGEAFARKMNLAAVAQDMLTNKLTITKGRFVQLADGISSASLAAVNASSRYNPLIAKTQQATSAENKFREALSSGGSELTRYQLLMGKATGESTKFQQAFAQIASSTQKTDIALQQSWNTVAKAEGALAKLGMQMTAQGANGEAFARKMDLTAISQDMLSNKLSISKGRFVQLAGGISSASQAAVNATNRYNPLVASSSRLTQETQLAQTAWQKFTGTFKNALATMTSWLPATMLVYGGLQTLKEAISTIIGFDQGLANLKAISNDTDAAVARMGDTIIDVADKTRYGATDIAGAMTTIAQAGFSAGESIEVVKSAALLASGTLEKITTTADLLTSTIRAFNLDATEASRVSDVYAAALNYTKLNVEALRTSMNYLGPAAYASGLSLEESAAAAGILADSGMRASTVGTSLRQMLARLVSPTEKLRKAFVENGIALRDVNPLTNDFATVIGNLGKVVTTSEKAFELFGVRAANAVLVLTRVGSEGFKVMLDNLMTVGTASTMAQKQMEGLGSMLENLKAKLGNLAIAFGQGGLVTSIRALMTAIRPLIDFLTYFANTTIGQFVIGTTLMTGAVYGLSKAFQLLAGAALSQTAMKMLAIGQTIYATAAACFNARGAIGALLGMWELLKVAVMANPFAAALIGISALVVGLQMLSQVSAKTTLEAEKSASAHIRNIEVLEKYKNKLDGVKEGSAEHVRVLARLAQEFPQLQQKIEAAGTSIEKQKQLIDELSASEKQLAEKNLEVALRGNTKSFEELNYKIAEAKEQLRSFAEDPAWMQLFNTIGDFVRGDYQNFLSKLSLLWTELKDAMGGGTPTMEVLNKKYNDLNNTQKRTKQTLGELAAEYEQLTGKKWDFGDLYIPTATVKSMYDLQKSIKDLEKSYAEMDAETRRIMQRGAVEELGEKWAELYDTLDEKGKASVASYAMQAKAKQDLVDKNAEKEMLTEEQVAERKKQIADEEYKAMIQKEQQKNNALLEAYKKYLEDYIKYAKDHLKAVDELYNAQNEDLKRTYADRATALERTYQDELNKLETSKMKEGRIVREKAALHDKYYKDLTDMNQQYMNEALALSDKEAAEKKQFLDRAYNDVLTNLQRESEQYGKLKDEALKLEREKEEGIVAIDRQNLSNKKAILNEVLQLTRSHIDQMRGEYERLAAEVRAIDESLAGYKNELLQGERKIRQSAMNEYQKYADNQKEYQRLIAEGNRAMYAESYKEAEKYFQEAAQLAQGMTGEIKNESGQVVVTAQENAQKLEVMYKAAMEGYKRTMEAQRTADTSRMEELMRQIKDLVALEDEIKKKVMEINAQEMRINTAAAESALKDMQRDLEQIDRQITELDGRTITIYKKIVTSGDSGGSDTGESSEWNTGGQLPGYGGGDIVNAKLEPGEFIMRKEAVKKYGAGFFEALNNMRLALPDTLKRYLKGSLGAKPKYAMAYQTGGLVGRSESLTLRLQVGAAELPVTVQGKNPKQQVKEFVKELSKMRLTRGN